MTNPLSRRGALTLAALAALTAVPAFAVAEEVIAVTANAHLITFDTATPGTLVSDHVLTGISGTVVAIDLRPEDGRLYAVTNRSQLYRIDPATGAATVVGTGPFALPLGPLTGMDVDPVTDFIRVVNDQNRNMRVNPDNGALVDGDPARFGLDEDLPLAYAPDDVNFGIDPTVVVIAHDNSRAGATTTTLFGIDSVLNVLVAISPADDGTLHTVGPLGLSTGYVAGFDVSGATGFAYTILTLHSEGVAGLYTVNLGTGAAVAMGIVGAPSPVVAMTIGTAPATSVARTALLGLTTGGELVRFMSDAPSTITKRVTVTGLVPGDTLVAIDVRPSTGRLYGLGSAGRIYVINAQTGVATPIRAAPFEVPLSGTAFGFDFNPTSSRVRIVGGDGRSLRVDPDTGAVVDGDKTVAGIQADTPLTFRASDVHSADTPHVIGLAFDRDATVGATTLFGIDATLGLLVRLGFPDGAPETPNSGLLDTVGSMGIDTTSFAGFEIAGDTTAFAAFGTTRGTTLLFSIDLATGIASPLAEVGVMETLRDLSVAPKSNVTAPVTDLAVRKVDIRLDFAHTGRDSATIEGSLPFAPGPFTGQVVTVDVGGFSKKFILGRAGNGKDDETTRSLKDDDRFGFTAQPIDGRIHFTVKFRRDDLAAALADENMGGSQSVNRQPRNVQITITVDGVVFSLPVTLRFTAKAGKSGVATKANV